jgi:hypothetical protein
MEEEIGGLFERLETRQPAARENVRVGEDESLIIR